MGDIYFWMYEQNRNMNQDVSPNTPNIPIESLEARINELNQYKQKKIIVYCRSGNRSGRGTDLLIHHGFDAVNLRGGMNQWAGPVAIKK